MKKTLTNMAGVGVLALSLIGCGQPEYRYDGKIGEEKVKYYDFDLFNNQHILEVTKSNGTFVKYRCQSICGYNNVQDVVIAKDGIVTGYEKDEIGTLVVKEGQKQYDNYLAKIIETKTKKGLEDIKE